MAIKYPFGLTKDEVIANYKKTQGGFYPLGENNMWHSGIHLNKNSEINPIFDGEIVAARVSDEYQIKQSINCFTKENIKKIKESKYVDSYGGIIESDQIRDGLYDELYTKFNSQSFIYENSELELEKFYRLASGIDARKLAIILDKEYSSDFVLIRHKTTTPEGEEILFFSLYMHLRPYMQKRYKPEEYFRHFIYDNTYTIEQNLTVDGIKLFNDDLSELEPVPLGSRVDFEGNIIFEDTSTYTKIRNYGELNTEQKFIKVKSRFNDQDGLIDNNRLSQDIDDCMAEYILTEPVDFFELGTLKKIGTIAAETTVLVLDRTKHKYFTMNIEDNDNFSYELEDEYLHIYIDKNQRHTDKIVQSERGYYFKRGYIRYKRTDEVVKRFTGGSKDINLGNLKMKVTAPIYHKDNGKFQLKKYDGTDRYIHLKEDDNVYFTDNVEIVDGFSYREIKSANLLDIGAIKANSSALRVKPITLNIVNERSVTEEITKYNQAEYLRQLPVIDSNGNRILCNVPDKSILMYNGETKLINKEKHFKVVVGYTGITGYVSLKHCKTTTEKIITTANNDIQLYKKGSNEVFCTLKQDSLFEKTKKETLPPYVTEDEFYEIEFPYATNEKLNIKFRNDDKDLYIKVEYTEKNKSKKVFRAKDETTLLTKSGRRYSVYEDKILPAGIDFTILEREIYEPTTKRINDPETGRRGVEKIEGYIYLKLKPLFKKTTVKAWYKVNDDANTTTTPVMFRVNMPIDADNLLTGYVKYTSFRTLYDQGDNHDGNFPIVNDLEVYDTLESANPALTLAEGTVVKFSRSKTFTITEGNFAKLIKYRKPEEEPDYVVGSSATVIEDTGECEAGLVLRNTIGENSEVIDIIPCGTDIIFENEQLFLTKPYGEHMVCDPNRNSFSTGYINVGEKEWLKNEFYIPKNDDITLPIIVDPVLKSEMNNNAVVVFDTPIKVNTNSFLGYPGTLLDQDNILHLEVFTGNTDFTDNGLGEDKPLYVANEINDNIKNVAERINKPEEITSIPRKSFFKDKTSSDDKLKFKNTIQLELLAGQAKPVYLGMTEDNKKIINKEFKILKTESSKLTIYDKCPVYSRKLNPEPVKYSIKTTYSVQGKTLSKSSYPNVPREKSEEFSDYRKMTIKKEDGSELVTGFVLRIDYKTFEVNTYKIKKDTDIMVYPSSPEYKTELSNKDDLTKLGLTDYKLIKGLVLEHETYPEEINDNKVLITKGSKIYLPTQLSDELNEINNDNIYIYTKENNCFICINAEKMYYQNEEVVNKIYKQKPEVYSFTHDPTQIAQNLEPSDLQYEIHTGELYDSDSPSDTNLYYEIICNGEKYYFKKDDISTLFSRKNYFNWVDFGFYKKEDDNDGIFELTEIIDGLDDTSTMPQNFMHNWLKSLKDNESEKLSKLIIKHPTEWEVKDDDFFDVLKDAPLYKLQDEEVDIEKDFNEKTAWWTDNMSIDNLPTPTNISYLHPIDFLEHLEHVAGIDPRTLMNGKGKDGTFKIGKMNVFINHYGLPGIKEALKRPGENWDNTSLGQNSRHETFGTYAENMETSLKLFFRMCADPEIQAKMGYNIELGSTFRLNDPVAKDPGHAQAIAIDLNGMFFYNKGYDGSANTDFKPDVIAEIFDIMAEKYGVKQFLFNCPRVIEKCKVAIVNGTIYGHHHHVHIDFHYDHEIKVRRDKTLGRNVLLDTYNCKHSGKYGDKPYECPLYNSCPYSKIRHKVLL